MIYDHNPHPPYFYLGNDCVFDIKTEIKYEEKNLLGSNYEQSYLCALNLNLKILNFIKENDPSSLVIFQSDSGWNSKNNFTMIYHKDLLTDLTYLMNPKDNLDTIHKIIENFN